MEAMAQGDFRLGGTAPNRTHDARPGLLVHDIRHEISHRLKGGFGIARMRRACAFPRPTDATARPAAMSCLFRLVGDAPIRRTPRFGVSCMREASAGIVGGPSGSRRMQSSRPGSPTPEKIANAERWPCPCTANADVTTISQGSGHRESADSRMSFASGSRASFRDLSVRSDGTKRGSTPGNLPPVSCNDGIALLEHLAPITAWQGCTDGCRSVESSRIGVAANSPRIRAVRVHLANLRPLSQAVLPQHVPSMLANRSDICQSHFLLEAYERLLRHVSGKLLVDPKFAHPSYPPQSLRPRMASIKQFSRPIGLLSISTSPFSSASTTNSKAGGQTCARLLFIRFTWPQFPNICMP